MKYVFLLAIALLLTACNSKTTENATDNVATKADESSEPNAKEIDSNARYKTGDDLYVFANSGLILRDKPDVSGAKIVSIPRGGSVKVTDTAPFQTAFSTKEPCGLEINGFWVKASHGGKEGYIFDGYLLKYKTLGDSDMATYWTALSKVKTSSDQAPKGDDVNYYVYNDYVWENGVKYTSSGYEGGSSSTLTLPKTLFTFQEAYLFGMTGLTGDAENPIKCTYNTKTQVVECISKDELSLTVMGLDHDGNFEITDSYAD